MNRCTLLAMSLFSMTSLYAQSNITTVEILIPYEDARGKWGYMDALSGETKIAPKYKFAHLFVDGIAEVSIPNPEAAIDYENVLIGWIDSSGKEIFEPQFTSVQEVKNEKNEFIADYRRVYTKDDKSGILTVKGNWIVPLGSYHDIRFFDSTHYIIDGKTFYHNGQKATAPKGSIITDVDFSEQLFTMVTDDNKAFKGICDWDGKIILEPKYIDIQYFPEKKRYVLMLSKGNPSDEDFMYGRVALEARICDGKGEELCSFDTDSSPLITNDYILQYELNEMPKYIDLITAQEVEENALIGSSSFKSFVENSLYGLKNEQGEIILPARYIYLQVADDQYAICVNAESHLYTVIHLPTKKMLLAPEYDFIAYDEAVHAFIASKKQKYGLVDTNGQVIIPFEYDYAFNFTNERAVVIKHGKRGLIDRNGKFILPAIYEEIFDQSDLTMDKLRYFTVKKNGKWGLVDSKGKQLLPCAYGYISSIDPPHWMQTENEERNLKGLYDLDTQTEIPPIYTIAYPLEQGIIVASGEWTAYSYQLLNNKGQPLSTADYSSILEGDNYLLTIKNQKYGVMNFKGDILIENKYDYLWPYTEQYMMVQQGERLFYIDMNGKAYTKE